MQSIQGKKVRPWRKIEVSDETKYNKDIFQRIDKPVRQIKSVRTVKKKKRFYNELEDE